MSSLKRLFVAAAVASFASSASAQVDQGGSGEGGGGGSFSGSGTMALVQPGPIVGVLGAQVCTSSLISSGDSVSVSIIWHDPASGWRSGSLAWSHSGEASGCSFGTGVFFAFPAGAVIYGNAVVSYSGGGGSPSFQLTPLALD